MGKQLSIMGDQGCPVSQTEALEHEQLVRERSEALDHVTDVDDQVWECQRPVTIVQVHDLVEESLSNLHVCHGQDVALEYGEIQLRFEDNNVINIQLVITSKMVVI